MDSLPPEIIRLCVSSLTRRADLASFSATSILHKIVAEEALYAHLFLGTHENTALLIDRLSEAAAEVPGRKRGQLVKSIDVEGYCSWPTKGTEWTRKLLRLVPNLESICMGWNRSGESLLRTVRENCPNLRKLDFVVEADTPLDVDRHMDELAQFTNLEEFTFRVEKESTFIIYEVPAQVVTMLLNSPNLKSLSIHGRQGRGWSLDIAPLLLVPFRPSLRSLTLQGVACNLSIENFEVDNRQLAEFFLSLVELEELSLGGSIGRRNMELRMIMKDALEEGERETLFPKLRKFEGTSSNYIWLTMSGRSPIDTIRINELEPIDEAEFVALLVAMPTTLVEASVCFARYDPLRPSIESAIERIAVVCPQLRQLTIGAVSSLRFSARSMTRHSTPSSYPSIIHAITKLPLLSSLRLPPVSACGVTTDLRDAEFFKACPHLLRLDFAGEEKDGHHESVGATRWERRFTWAGEMLAVEIYSVTNELR